MVMGSRVKAIRATTTVALAIVAVTRRDPHRVTRRRAGAEGNGLQGGFSVGFASDQRRDGRFRPGLAELG